MIDLKTLNFIKSMVFHTMQMNLVYSPPPYGNIEEHDMGLNRSLNNSEDLYRQMRETFSKLEHHRFNMITSRFLVHFVVFMPFDDSRDLISVGPYLESPVTDELIKELTTKNHMSYTDTDTLKGFFYSLPVLSKPMLLTTVLTDILTYISPAAPSFHIRYYDFSVHSRDKLDYTPREDFSAYADSVDRRYKVEGNLLSQIAKGNYTEAMRYSQEFLSQLYLPNTRENFFEHQAALISANTLFRKAVEVNEIHPVHLHNISSKYLHSILKATSISELYNKTEKMIRDYCLLVNNHSMRQYSPHIRHILNYIEFHLDTSLSLPEIAEACGMSVSYLSATFKKTMGLSVIAYVNQQRIHQALHLLNTSDYSIQEISSHVGILDYNYFTKIFKKEIGCTPSEYRKRIHQ